MAWDNQFQSAPTFAGILEGISRKTGIRLARRAGVEVFESNLARTDLQVAAKRA